jgi:alanine dehydrogenase
MGASRDTSRVSSAKIGSGGIDIMTNKVVVITGGASGMGRATALAFAREGAKVIIGEIILFHLRNARNSYRATCSIEFRDSIEIKLGRYQNP